MTQREDRSASLPHRDSEEPTGQAAQPGRCRRLLLEPTRRLTRLLGWAGSLGVHLLALFLLSLLTWQLSLSENEETLIVSTDLSPAGSGPHQEKSIPERLVLESRHNTPASDPAASATSDIVVPPDILARAELGDHFETLNPAQPDAHSVFGSPQAHLFFAQGDGESAGGGGAHGQTLCEIIGVGGGGSPGTGGGWGGGQGTGVGASTGAGRGAFGSRSGGGRRLMVMRHGGSRAHENARRALFSARETRAGRALQAAVKWLAASQEPDGRWACRKYDGKDCDTAVTGLALMTFLACGQGEAKGPYREHVRRAAAWLRQQQDPDGRIRASEHPGYSHGIAGLGLAETTRAGATPETVEAAQRAVRWSCAGRPGTQAQNGWRYDGPSQEGDLAVSSWYILQLAAARRAGLEIPEGALERAWTFLDSVSITSGQGAQAAILGYHYKPGSDRSDRLNAMGHSARLGLARALRLEGSGGGDLLAAGGAPSARRPDLYFWYHAAQAAALNGGRGFQRLGGEISTVLVETQRSADPARGSWDPAGEYSNYWGRVGQTALASLCLAAAKDLPPTKPADPKGDPAPPAPQDPPGPGAGVPPGEPGDRAPKDQPNAESYAHLEEKGFTQVESDDALSTFAIDVDTASYSNIRRFLTRAQRPPTGAVRLEELVNYFDYAYPPPAAGDFAVHAETASCPWNPEHRLVRLAVKGREVEWERRPASNLVFLVDVSGSMAAPEKLPLVQRSLALLVKRLDGRDRVALVVYAGSSGLVLDSTSGQDSAAILGAVERLSAGGSTNGGQGIQLAYQVAQEHFVKGGTNRVVLCTDGDFNVGVTSQDALIELVQAKAKQGVFLTVLGFGMGNLKDSTLEQLADKGNGNYGYIDNEAEARKLLVAQAGGTLITIAKDVKIQVEFNPEETAAYRLLGYENRLMAAKEFRDDKKDAGEVGAGHSVTALYEIVPAHRSSATEASGAGPLKYQKDRQRSEAAASGELLTLYLRHKLPDAEAATEKSYPVLDRGGAWKDASADFRWAAAVAIFGMQLRNSPNKAQSSWALARELAAGAAQPDPYGYRREFLELIERARQATASNPVPPPGSPEDDQF